MRKFGTGLSCLICLLAITACDPNDYNSSGVTTPSLTQNLAPFTSAELAPIIQAQGITFVIGTGPINFRTRGGAKADGTKVPGVLLSTLGVPDQVIVQKFIPMLAKELSLYPPGSLQHMGIDKIVLTQHLTVDGQPRSAMPLFEQRVVVYDIELGNLGQQIMASILHHENFHMADYVGDQTVRVDPEWEALNQSSFHYSSGGQDMQSQDVTQWDDRLQGLLNRYSTSALEEDKAEIFAALMWAPNELRARAARDPIIQAKGRKIISILSALDPQFTVAYFQDVAAKRMRLISAEPGPNIFTPYGWKLKVDVLKQQGTRR